MPKRICLLISLVSFFVAGSAASAADPGKQPGFVANGPDTREGARFDLTRVTPMPLPQAALSKSRITATQDFGPLTFLPFSTARADLEGTAENKWGVLPTNKMFPYSAVGKLIVTCPGPDSGKIGACNQQGQMSCTATLIKRGVIITAAHCASTFGDGTPPRPWGRARFDPMWFVPEARGSEEPLGRWEVQQSWVRQSWWDGTDLCANGPVCKNDVAVLVLKNKDGKFPGDETGYLAFGYDGTGFTFSRNISSAPTNPSAHLTSLGYPGCLDLGAFLERTDTQAEGTSSNFYPQPALYHRIWVTHVPG